MSTDLTIKTNKNGFDVAKSKLDDVLGNLGEAYNEIDIATDKLQDNWIGISGNALVCGNLSLQLTFTDEINELLQLRKYIQNAQEAIDNTDQSCGEKFSDKTAR